MAWRFRKTIPLFGRWFRVSLSKSGVGASVGIPGTGLSVGRFPSQSRNRRPGASRPAEAPRPRLDVVRVTFWVLLIALAAAVVLTLGN